MHEQLRGYVTDVAVTPAVVPEPSDCWDVVPVGIAEPDTAECRRHRCSVFHQ
jgi:hypothetical protein